MINTSHRKRNELLDEALTAQKALEKRNNIIPRKRNTGDMYLDKQVCAEYEQFLDKIGHP